MRSVHAALGRRLLVLLDCHVKTPLGSISNPLLLQSGQHRERRRGTVLRGIHRRIALPFRVPRRHRHRQQHFVLDQHPHIGMGVGWNAVEIFVDMLITDLTMADLTGLELSEKVKSLRPDIPVILITGYSDQVSKDAAVGAGINEYCMKPISMRELSTIVGKFLGSGKGVAVLQRYRSN